MVIFNSKIFIYYNNSLNKSAKRRLKRAFEPEKYKRYGVIELRNQSFSSQYFSLSYLRNLLGK